MTVTVALRSEQSDPLAWSQVDGNFSGLATQVNINTEDITAVTATANTAATEAAEALTQIAALDVSTTVDWFASSTFYESLPAGAKGFFTPGTTTTLVLSNAYGTTSNVQPDFDGLIQGLEQFTLSGTSIIFDSAIPIGVENVHVKGGGILVANVPSNGSVGVPQLAADVLAYFTKVPDLASQGGAGLVGYQPLGTGAAATTVEASLRRYFVDGDAYINPSYSRAGNNAGWSALLTYIATLPGGCHVMVSAGTFLFSAATPLAVGMILTCAGKTATIFSYSQATDGMTMTSPINSSTGVYTKVQNLQLLCTNGASTGGGYVDRGGTFVTLENVISSGWKYGAILDQSELVTLEKFHATSNVNGLWITNGADRTPGAYTQYSNRITVNGCQFNACTGVGIIDDGGIAHRYSDLNVNDCGTGMRIAGCPDMVIDGASEWEGLNLGAIDVYHTTLVSGTNVGYASVALSGASLQNGSTFCVRFNSVGGAQHAFASHGNSYVGSSGNPAIIGTANIGQLSLGNDEVGLGAYTDADGTASPDFSHLSNPVHQFRQIAGAGSAAGVQVYNPSAAGGGGALSAIVMAANNSIGNKVNYASIVQAISNNTAGSEGGYLYTYTMSSGANTLSTVHQGNAWKVIGGFGCNGKNPQTAAVSGGTLGGVIAALVANGILSS